MMCMVRLGINMNIKNNLYLLLNQSILLASTLRSDKLVMIAMSGARGKAAANIMR